MDIVWSAKIDQVLKVGHQLTGIGLRNWALTRSQALNALENLLEYRVPVLGGDVCENIEGTIKPNYDSWYCDPLPGEDDNIFLRRSIAKATDYIKNYPIADPDRVFFAIVPKV